MRFPAAATKLLFGGTLAFVCLVTSPVPAFGDEGVISNGDNPTFPLPSESGAPNNRFIVRFKNQQGKEAALQAATVVHHDLPSVSAVASTMNPRKAEALMNNPNIDIVEIDHKMYQMGHVSDTNAGLSSLRGSLADGTNHFIEKTDNPSTPTRMSPSSRRLNEEIVPYGIDMVLGSPPDSLGGLPGGPTKKVCIIDTGYDFGHPDLPSSVVEGTSVSQYLWNFDCDSHGTHVAGTIAGITGNSIGVKGVLQNTEVNDNNAILHIANPLGGRNQDCGCGCGYTSDTLASVQSCVANGADVISMSLGCTGKRCESDTANEAYNQAYDNGNGVLIVAAAGNDGNRQESFPASYQAVVSVAAVGSNGNVASFSQFNRQVELAAPGIDVLSTVKRGTGSINLATVDSISYDAKGFEYSPVTGDNGETGFLVDCGLAATGTSCPGGPGQVCLIQRGSYSFSDKTKACKAGGGVAAIIYNNVEEPVSGTLEAPSDDHVPVVLVSMHDGAILQGETNKQATVTVLGNQDYDSYSGTSMATPHVAGVAALVWSYHPDCNAGEIRNALTQSALDKGASGRDNYYGYGIVQAMAAKQYLDSNGCAGGGETPTPAPDTPTPPPGAVTWKLCGTTEAIAEASCPDATENECANNGQCSGGSNKCWEVTCNSSARL